MPNLLTIRTAPLEWGAKTGALVIYAAEGNPPKGEGAAIWAATGLDWNSVATDAGFRGKQGNVLDLVAPAGLQARRLLVLGSGRSRDDGAPLAAGAWSDRGGSLSAKLAAAKISSAAVILDAPEATPETVAQLAAGLRLRHYRFDKYKTRPADENGDGRGVEVVLHVADPAACDAAIAERMAVVEGTITARDLIHEPANVLGPAEFASEARKLTDRGVEIEVLDPEELQQLGMNALLAVARGSARPPRVVIMRWNGAGDAQPVVVIGKGVVFDSGGISIKPAANMEDMKADMSGAAAVVGLMHALAARGARTNVVGLAGLVENMPDGNAMRPGDIVRAMSGTTIEIVNTDAEGRLVLADLLWYAQDRFKPRAMIDLATLTGAISVALGQDHAGLFSNNDELAEGLLAAGLATGEKLWRLPLGPAYDKMIESRFADIKNSAGRPASAITAAQFLQRFVNSTSWAHLDIAGTAFAAQGSETNASWAPGFGVALLERLIREHYEG